MSETKPATAAYYATTTNGPFDHQRDAYEQGYEDGAAAERERIRRFAAAMRSDSADDSDVLALIREFETAAAAAERQLCAQLAEQHRAHYGCYVSVGDTVTSGLRSFADLLREPQPATTQEQP